MELEMVVEVEYRFGIMLNYNIVAGLIGFR